jgi:hypothetical protein
MKYLLTLIFFIVIVVTVFSQDIRIHVKPLDGTSWAYADAKGDIVFYARYVASNSFTEDGFTIQYSNIRKEYYIVNRYGEKLNVDGGFFVPQDYLSYYIEGFSNGLLIVRQDKKKWGVIDTAGYFVIPPKWDRMVEFSEGYGFGILKGRFYLINKSSLKETPLPDEIKEVKHFQEGLAPCRVRGGMEGFIDTLGQIVIIPEFRQVGYFNDGIAWAKGMNFLIGYIDRKGKWIVEPKYNEGHDYDKISGLARVRSDVLWYYVNKKGDSIRFDNSEIVDDFHDGLARGKQNGLYGFYNNRGEWVIKPQFVGARDFKNGYAGVGTKQYWGVIDVHAKWLFEPKFEMVKDVVILR